MAKKAWYELRYAGYGSCADTSSVHHFYGTLDEMPRYSHAGLGLVAINEVTDEFRIACLEGNMKKVDEILKERIVTHKE